MDTVSLKKYIFENQKIEFVLNKIGCHHIQYHSNKDFYSCGNYNGDNPGAINIKNNKFLNVKNWTREKEFGDAADIITLVEYNNKCSFVDAIKFLHSILGLEYKWQKSKVSSADTKVSDPLYIFKKVQSNHRVNVNELQILNEDLLDDYIPLIYIDWFREGIMPWSAKKFGLAYSYRKKRIIIPMRYWLTGELLGINSRTTVVNYKEFGIKKFFITPSYPKSLNIYGLYENYTAIQQAGYVVVYESEKSVLKRDSRHDSTGVALSGHTISDEQVRILVGLNVDIIISMDKDVPLEEIRHICNKFYGIRNVFYTYDKWDLLDEKDSIADKPKKIFDFFIKYKIRFDIQEHKKYLKQLCKEELK